MHRQYRLKVILASSLTICSGAVLADNLWSGFYTGAKVGSRQTTTEWNSMGAQLPFAPHTFLPTKTDNTATTQEQSPYFGAHLGYNWHFGSGLIMGLEGSLGYARNSSSIHSIPGLTSLGLRDNMSSIHVKKDWEASLVGRLGYLLKPDILVYGLGGVAAERVKLSGYCPGDGVLCAPDWYPTTSKQNVAIGWTTGLGLEYSLTERIVGRLEYRYARYKGTDFQAIELMRGQSFGVPGGTQDNTSEMLSIGLSYRF